MWLDLGETLALNPGQHADRMILTISAGDRGYFLTALRCDNPRKLQIDLSRGEKPNELILQLENCEVFGTVGDFEDKLLAGSGLQQKVLIALTRQRCGRRPEAIQLSRDAGRIIRAEARRPLHGHDHMF